MAGNVLTLTDANFQSEVLDSQQPVLVDFWAPWCGPCKMIAPTIDAVATEYLGKVRVGKVNTDDNPKTASSYSISAIPDFMSSTPGPHSRPLPVWQGMLAIVPRG